MNEFGDRLKRLREELGLGVVEFASSVGVTRQTINYYEHGERYPDVRILSKIVEVTGCSAGYLLGIDGAMFATAPDDEEHEVLGFLLFNNNFKTALSYIRLMSGTGKNEFIRDVCRDRCMMHLTQMLFELPDGFVNNTPQEKEWIKKYGFLLRQEMKGVEENEASR